MTHETKPKTELLGKVLSKANKEKATMSEVKAAAKSILSESDYKIWIDTIYDASYGEALMLKIAQSIAKAIFDEPLIKEAMESRLTAKQQESLKSKYLKGD